MLGSILTRHNVLSYSFVEVGHARAQARNLSQPEPGIRIAKNPAVASCHHREHRRAAGIIFFYSRQS